MKKIQKAAKENFELSHFKVIFNFESFLCSNEPNNYIKEIEAQLVTQNASASDKNAIVGVANIYKVELGRAMNERQSTAEIFDSFNDELFDYYETLFDLESEEFNLNLEKLAEPGMGSDLLIIDKVEIIPNYRGMNLGLVLAQEAISNLSGGCQYVTLRPFPLQFGPHKKLSSNKKTDLKYDLFDRDEKKAFIKLRNYWGQLNFVRVGKSNVFLKSPDTFPHINVENFFKTPTSVNKSKNTKKRRVNS